MLRAICGFSPHSSIAVSASILSSSSFLSPSSSFNQKVLEPCHFFDEKQAVEEDLFLLPAISDRKYNVLQRTKQSPTPIRNKKSVIQSEHKHSQTVIPYSPASPDLSPKDHLPPILTAATQLRTLGHRKKWQSISFGKSLPDDYDSANGPNWALCRREVRKLHFKWWKSGIIRTAITPEAIKVILQRSETLIQLYNNYDQAPEDFYKEAENKGSSLWHTSSVLRYTATGCHGYGRFIKEL